MEEVERLFKNSTEEMEKLLTAKSVVGEPMVVDGYTIVPLLSPNPPKDTDGRREGSGRGWVRELQGRWPGVLG